MNYLQIKMKRRIRTFSLCFKNTIPAFATISNPLPAIDSLPELVKTILSIVVKVGLPLIAVLFVWTGFKFLTAQGNDQKLTEAKSSFTWTVVGAAVLLGAWVLATLINATIAAVGAE